MKREAMIKVVLDCGDDAMPGDRALGIAIEEHVEGSKVWIGKGKIIAGKWEEPTVVIDSAFVTLGEVVSA